MKTTQPTPESKPWLSEAEMNSLSAAYMLAIIALCVGIGIYAICEAAVKVYRHIAMRKYAKKIGQQIEKELTKLAMKEREGVN